MAMTRACHLGRLVTITARSSTKSLRPTRTQQVFQLVNVSQVMDGICHFFVTNVKYTRHTCTLLKQCPRIMLSAHTNVTGMPGADLLLWVVSEHICYLVLPSCFKVWTVSSWGVLHNKPGNKQIHWKTHQRFIHFLLLLGKKWKIESGGRPGDGKCKQQSYGWSGLPRKYSPV